MSNVHTIRLLVVAAAIELATGISLYAFPRDFSSDIYAPVLPYFPYLSATLLAGGILLLLTVRYQLPRSAQRLLVLPAAFPLLVLARFVAEAGGYTGATSYTLTAISIILAPWLGKEPDRARETEPLDLFALTLGVIHLIIGALMLTAPQLFHSRAFGPIQPFLRGIGLVSLVMAVVLVVPAVRRRLPVSARRMAGLILPLLLSGAFAVSGAWTGTVMWLLWALGSLLDSHPVLENLSRGAAPTLTESDEDWSVRAERSMESWTWILMLVVVSLTAFLGPEASASIPRAFLFVLLLGGYNIIVGWLLPPFGTSRLRLNLHLLVTAAAIGLLLSGASPVASALLPVLLAVPMLSARTLGRTWGYAMLAAVLVILVLSSLMDLWVDHLPFKEVMANLVIQIITLGSTGAMGVAAAVEQRNLFHRLATTTQDLAAGNEELQAANEELMAQSEELMAQSEELQAQQEELQTQQEELQTQQDDLRLTHDRLLEQSALLAAQRDELLESETRFRAAFEHAPIGMAMVSLDLTIIKANRAMGEMLGYSPDELIGRSSSSLAHPEHRPEGSTYLNDVLAGRSEGYRIEKRYLHRDGHAVWVIVSVAVVRDTHGLPLYLLSQLLDVTDRRRAEEQLRHLANYDPLTELFNRRRFQQELDAELERASRDEHQGAVLFLDFDQFKYVNDTLGHRAGDELLKSLARVLESTVGERGLIGRMGGDEFAIVVPGTDPPGAEALATEVLQAVRSHMEVVAGQPVGMTVSIGVALYPQHGRTVEELMLHADLAMYHAKEDGRNRHRFYTLGDREAEMGFRLNWERRIREALAADRFLLHFQPIVDLHTGQVIMYEALLRLVEPDGTLVSPRHFLGVAESYGLIHAIDRWVVRRAIRTIAEERRRGRHLTLGVNLSARAFSDTELLPLIQSELLKHDVPPEALHFEITETAAVAEIGPAKAFIGALTEMGCAFALDDFGAGFSSLVYLKQLPVSYLKIDGSFIERLPEQPIDQKMVKAVVNLAREMGMQTVAEYVGSDQTVALLRELGVDRAQGYHLGRPAPLPELDRQVAGGK